MSLSLFDKLAFGALFSLTSWNLSTALLTSDIPSDLASEVTPSLRLPPHTLSQHHITSLNINGFTVIPNALPKDLINKARAGALSLYESDPEEFGAQNSTSVRTDKVSLISASSAIPAPLLLLLHHLRSLAAELDAIPSYTLTSSHRVPHDCQLSIYDGNGSFYKPHRDNPQVGYSLKDVGLMPYLKSAPYRKRGLTAIIYLNDAPYAAKNGGALSLYPTADDAETVPTDDTESTKIDVYPEGGTLVLFDSRRILHQVQPTHTKRVAITLWIEGVSKNYKEESK